MLGIMQLPHYVLILVSCFATMKAQLQQQQQHQQPGISYHNSWLYSMPWRPLILPTVARLLPSLPGASQLSPGYTGPQTFPQVPQDQQQQQQQQQSPYQQQQQQSPYQQQQPQNPYQQQQQQNPFQQQQQQNPYQQQQQQQNPFQQQQQQNPYQHQQQQNPFQQQQNPYLQQQQQQQQYPPHQFPPQQFPSQQPVLLGLFTPQLQVHPLAAPPPQAGHFSLPFRPSPFAGYTDDDEEENQVVPPAQGNQQQQQQQQQQHRLEEPPFHAHPYKPVAEGSELSRGAAGGGGYVYLSPSNLYNLVRS